jgi:PAS domain S-box-containing protein
VRFLVSYQMITGVVERYADSADETRSIVDAAIAAGARPLSVQCEDQAGARKTVAYLGFGDAKLAELNVGKSSMIPSSLPTDRRIDPSVHSISLADARRPDCPLIYVNRGFERLTGYRREEALGRNCRFLQGPETDSFSIKRMREALSAGEALILDLLNYRKDGSKFWNRISLQPVLSADGQVTHVIGIQSDVSQLIQLQDNLEQWARELAGGTRPAP